MRGIDVSHDQGAIDWAAAFTGGISFAYAKATEGTGFVDPDFTENWAGMKAAGVLRGAYHFFHPSMDAGAQAAHFIATLAAANSGLATLNPGDLPPMLDLEYTNDTPLQPTEYVAAVQVWLGAVEAATGRQPIIYTSASFWDGATASSVAMSSYGLWVAEYGVQVPKLPAGWNSYAIWQTGVGAAGTVPGVNTSCDLDTFNGTLAEFQVLAGQSPSQ